jgi:hypothetical protein
MTNSWRKEHASGKHSCADRKDHGPNACQNELRLHDPRIGYGCEQKESAPADTAQIHEKTPTPKKSGLNACFAFSLWL